MTIYDDLKLVGVWESLEAEGSKTLQVMFANPDLKLKVNHLITIDGSIRCTLNWMLGDRILVAINADMKKDQVDALATQAKERKQPYKQALNQAFFNTQVYAVQKCVADMFKNTIIDKKNDPFMESAPTS